MGAHLLLFLPIAIAKEGVNPSSPLAIADKNKSIADKFVDKWMVTNPERPTEKAMFVFTPTGEVYRLEVLGNSPQTSYRLLTSEPSQYEIINSGSPVQIKIKSKNNTYTGIWELVSDRQLKLKQFTTNSHRRRFNSKALVLNKITADPILPPTVETTSATINSKDSQPQKPELVTRINLRWIDRVQRVYHRKYNCFSPTFDRLKISTFTGVTDANPQVRSYTYRLVDSNHQRAIITAIPQEKNLHGYAAAIYSYPQAKNRSSMTSIICESDRVSDRVPGIPQLVQSGNNYTLQCAAGSHAVK
jgi:hypothetical protein